MQKTQQDLTKNRDAAGPLDVYVYYHTHWDREWYLPFREYQYRLLKVVDDVLETVENKYLPCFTLDGQTVLLEDYLEFRPQNQSRIEALVKDDRISIGPWYVMPDEFLVSGESLVRNLQRGIKTAAQFGETTFTGYLPDTFGHSADIPMLLNQCGIRSAIVWRGVKPQSSVFFWESPSKDTVLTYHLSEGYFQHIFHMGDSAEAQTEFIRGWLAKAAGVTPAGYPILLPVGADHLGVVQEAPSLLASLVPQAVATTPDTLMNSLSQSDTVSLPVLEGELRDFNGPYLLPGVFSSRLYLKQWNRRLEWRLTRQLEQLMVWRLLQGKPEYGLLELDFLWKTLLLNHPHDSICGCSVDSVHRENEVRFEQVDQLSQAMLDQLHHELRQTMQPPGQALLLNLGDKPYTGVVEIQRDYPCAEPAPESLPYAQVIDEAEVLDETFRVNTCVLPLSENKALRRRSLVWANAVPAHGIQTLGSPVEPPDRVSAGPNWLENGLLRVEVTDAGDITVTDKTQRKTFTGLHQLWRQAEQGDSYNAAPVPGLSPERARLTACTLELEGPLRSTLHLHYHFQSIDLTVETRLSLEAGSPRITFDTAFTNNTPDHKIQAVFEAGNSVTQVVAEGHFSPVTRTYDPAYRITDHMPAPSQKELLVQSGAIQRFIGYHNQTLLTEGLTEYEVEGSAVKLTLLRAFGMLSKHDTGVRGSHAGPPLPTPEGQCLNRNARYRYAWVFGFSLEEAYCQADWFYGAVYGFDRQTEGALNMVPQEHSFLPWESASIISTATVPGEDYWDLRVFNPDSTPQTITLGEPLARLNGAAIDLLGRDTQAPASSQWQIAPYQLQTLRFPVQSSV